MKEDKQLLMLAHLSQLLDFISVIGGFVVPLILWVLKRDEVLGMDFHGKAILNFRISMFLYLLICVPFIIYYGIGLVGWIILGIFYFIYPIINAVKVTKGEMIHYPFSIKFIK